MLVVVVVVSIVGVGRCLLHDVEKFRWNSCGYRSVMGHHFPTNVRAGDVKEGDEAKERETENAHAEDGR